jgi:hypothetical protein
MSFTTSKHWNGNQLRVVTFDVACNHCGKTIAEDAPDTNVGVEQFRNVNLHICSWECRRELSRKNLDKLVELYEKKG